MHERTTMSKESFHQIVADVTSQIAGRPLDAELDRWLNTVHGVGSESYERLKQACIDGVAEGWLCEREGGGIKYGRVFKAEDALHRFSVDVVDMKDIEGPHHAHPNGEVDLIFAKVHEPSTHGEVEGDVRMRHLETSQPRNEPTDGN